MDFTCSLLVLLLPVMQLTSTENELIPEGCMKPFQSDFNSTCFFVSNETLGWKDAKTKCSDLGGRLAEPKSSEVNEFLKNNLKTSGKAEAFAYYLGGNDRSTEGRWLWASDNSSITFEDWYPGQPDDLNHNMPLEDCLTMRNVADYMWNDVTCSLGAGFICETSTNENCPAGFPVRYDLTTCFFISNQTLVWDDAKEKCSELGAMLAEPRSTEAIRFLRNHLKDSGTADEYYLGGSDANSEGNWVWVSDNATIVFTDWDEGEPNNGDEGEDCLALRKEFSYQWDDGSCSWTRHFICERQKVIPAVPSGETVHKQPSWPVIVAVVVPVVLVAIAAVVVAVCLCKGQSGTRQETTLPKQEIKMTTYEILSPAGLQQQSETRRRQPERLRHQENPRLPSNYEGNSSVYDKIQEVTDHQRGDNSLSHTSPPSSVTDQSVTQVKTVRDDGDYLILTPFPHHLSDLEVSDSILTPGHVPASPDAYQDGYLRPVNPSYK